MSLIQQQLAQQITSFQFLIFKVNRCDLHFSNLCNFGQFVSPIWVSFHHLDSPRSCSSAVSLVLALTGIKEMLLIIAIGVVGLYALCVYCGLIFQISQNASNNNTSSLTSKVADKDDDDALTRDDCAIQNQSKGDSNWCQRLHWQK